MKPVSSKRQTETRSEQLVPATIVERSKWMVACVAAFLVFIAAALSSAAADYSMTAGDSFGEHSFDSAGHWSSGAAPAAGNNYSTAGFIVRSPTSGSLAVTFAGDSLTVASNGALYCKYQGISMTVNTLTNNNGRIVNAQGGGFTMLGNLYVPVAGAMDTGSGNSSINDVRYVTNAMTIFGTGNLTNYTSETAGTPLYWQTARGAIIYTGNNTGFTGRQIIWKNQAVIVSSQANLGGNPASFTPGQLTLDNGILRPSASFALTNVNGGITINSGGGLFDLGMGILLTNTQPIAGVGTLSFTNVGTFVQSGLATNFTGTLAINNGSFILTSSNALAGPNTISIGSAATFNATAAGLTLGNGQTLAGNGTITGNVTAPTGGKISPAGAGATATLTITGDLNLTGGATLAVDFATTNDVIAVGGNLTPSGTTIVQPLTVPAVGVYVLATVTGTLNGTSNNFTVNALTTRNRSYKVMYDTVSVPNRILLQVTSAGTAANLVWQGDGGANAWDVNTTANWLNGVSTDVSFDGDTNNFTDAGIANQPTLNVAVNPGEVNFNMAGNYTLTGSGAIAGSTAVNKGGTGIATISTTNTYTGGTVVTNGVLQLGAVGALGSPSSGILANVSNTGTIDIDGQALDAATTNTIRINGNGFSATQGAIDNTIGGLTSGGGDIGIATLTLAGNSTISATANWQIGNTGSGIVGNGFTLTKIGDGYLYLKHAAASPVSNFILGSGAVLFWDRADALGTTATITLTNGSFIDTWNPATFFQGLTFANPIVVGSGAGGMIVNVRTPFNHPGADIFNGSVVLNGTLTFSNTAFVGANQFNNNLNTFGKDTINGNISGTGGIIALGGTSHFVGSGAPEFYGGNMVTLTGNNSYSGPTLVTNLVQLLITTANQSGSSYDVADYGTLDVTVAPGKPTIPMSSLTIEQVNLGPANIGFTRLPGMPTNPVIYATNLTINSGVILPPLAGYMVGQFPLIKYDTISGAGFAGLQLGSLPVGVTATLVDNTANKTIDLSVTAAGIVWKGTVSSNWDIGSTANWFNPVTSSTEGYADGETVVFDDTATSFNVALTTTVLPGGVTVNANNNYDFSGNNIGGSGALIKNGSGTLTISVTNNIFTGGTYINGGTIKLADKNYAFPYGGGALNNSLGNVTVSGGTLDVNSVQVPNFQSFGPEGYNVFLSGSGVGGNGALINSSTTNNDNAGPGYVTLANDATVGGAGDVNIRHGVSPQLSSQSGAYTLTKMGAGQFRIRYVTAVSTNFGAVKILQGNVTYESSSPLGFGDASKPITIGNGGGFGWGTTNTTCLRTLICSNGASILGLNFTNNIFNGAVTLDSGNVTLNANFYNGMIFSNVLSGAGGITVAAQSRVSLMASNTFTGNTTVVNCNGTNGNNNGSILRLFGNGSINNSPNITLGGITPSQSFPGAIDASTRADGTLTLQSGQTLRGDNGSYVKGNVTALSGATLTPGGAANIQYMSISNNLTLNTGSTVAVDISLDGGVTNDVIKVAGALSYGGTLQVANIGTTALTNGATFKLFTQGSFTGTITNIVGSPGTGLAYSFNPTNGTLSVVSTGPLPSPVMKNINIVGTNVIINATNNAGTSGGTYALLSSTNITVPLSNWTVLSSGSFDANGNLSLTNGVGSADKQFYILRVP